MKKIKYIVLPIVLFTFFASIVFVQASFSQSTKNEIGMTGIEQSRGGTTEVTNERALNVVNSASSYTEIQYNYPLGGVISPEINGNEITFQNEVPAFCYDLVTFENGQQVNSTQVCPSLDDVYYTWTYTLLKPVDVNPGDDSGYLHPWQYSNVDELSLTVAWCSGYAKAVRLAHNNLTAETASVEAEEQTPEYVEPHISVKVGPNPLVGSNLLNSPLHVRVEKSGLHGHQISVKQYGIVQHMYGGFAPLGWFGGSSYDHKIYYFPAPIGTSMWNLAVKVKSISYSCPAVEQHNHMIEVDTQLLRII